MADTWRDRLGRGLDYLEEAAGRRAVPRERLQLLEQSDVERRAVQRELDLLAYQALNYAQGQPQELKIVERRKLVQQARVAWMKDPQAGAAVDLMNDFVFGRGLPKPKANDPEVQKVIDETWDDPDNQLVLTSYAAQVSLGTDLSLQSNVFFLVFDDGDDGKVKLGILDHDSVETVVRDPENRLRVLYYVARETRQEWDYQNDQPKVVMRPGYDQREIKYYEHWRNVDDAMEDAEAGNRERPELAPAERCGDGRVFHIAINKTTEMAFGHPVMDRLIPWYNAYNKFMDARVDIMEAKAAFVMKRKVKGTPSQLQKMATQAISRRSALGASLDYPEAQGGPKPASILNENENVTHEDMKMDTGAAGAQQDAQMLRAQISAGTRFPQSYYGDAANSNLATATSLELPVLKAVENRQEVVEAVVRFMCDKAIERAVDVGRLSEELTDEEKAALERDKQPDAGDTIADAQSGGVAAGPIAGPPPMRLQGAHEDAVADEEATQRDLSYEFQMPSPLKRMMTDLVTSVQNIAQTFDPNNTNVELSRILLTVALGDGLELEDPAGAVEKIFPEGYVDPALAAAQQQQQQDPRFGEFGPQQQTGAIGADGQRHQEGNAYGAPSQASSPDDMPITEAKLPPDVREALERHRAAQVGLDEILARHANGAGNGNGLKQRGASRT